MTNKAESKTSVLEEYSAITAHSVHQLPSSYTEDLLYFCTFLKNQYYKKPEQKETECSQAVKP